MSPLSRANSALTAVVLLVISSAMMAAPAAGTPGTLLVGYAPGGAPPAALATVGDVLSTDPALGLAVLVAPDAAAAWAMLAGAPGVDFVELDGGIRAAGASQQSARWDSARWDSAR